MPYCAWLCRARRKRRSPCGHFLHFRLRRLRLSSWRGAVRRRCNRCRRRRHNRPLRQERGLGRPPPLGRLPLNHRHSGGARLGSPRGVLAGSAARTARPRGARPAATATVRQPLALELRHLHRLGDGGAPAVAALPAPAADGQGAHATVAVAGPVDGAPAADEALAAIPEDIEEEQEEEEQDEEDEEDEEEEKEEEEEETPPVMRKPASAGRAATQKRPAGQRRAPAKRPAAASSTTKGRKRPRGPDAAPSGDEHNVD